MQGDFQSSHEQKVNRTEKSISWTDINELFELKSFTVNCRSAIFLST